MSWSTCSRTRCSCILIFPATRTWRSVWRACSAFAFPLNFNSPFKCRQHHRLLAALAHDADALYLRYSLQSDFAVDHSAAHDQRTVYQPKCAAHRRRLYFARRCTHIHDHVFGWSLAWSRSAIHCLGRLACLLFDHEPCVANFRSEEKGAGPEAKRSRVSILWRVGLTYASVLLAQVFFRSASIPDALRMFAGAAGLHGYDFPLSVAGFRLDG